jgi:hypothetical protein
MREIVNRKPHGSLGTLLMAVLLLITFAVGSLGVDFMHMLAVKNELQNGVDAGALAGAQDLWTDLVKAEEHAFRITAANKADGKLIANTSPKTTVQVLVVPPTVVRPGSVRVDASMEIRHLLAPMIPRWKDTIRATAVAGTSGSLVTLFGDNYPFPLAVSASGGQNGPQLIDMEIGDSYTLYINSQQYKNAGWTSFSEDSANRNYIQGAIDQALGIEQQAPGYIPSVSIGDFISLNNGVMGQMQLGNSPYYEALLDPNRPPLILPVVEDAPTAMNQRSKVIGFIGFRVTSILRSGKDGGGGGGVVEALVGTIVRPQVRGTSGDPTGSEPINQLAIGPVQLIR